MEATHDSAPETVPGGSTADIQVRYVLVNIPVHGVELMSVPQFECVPLYQKQKQLRESLCENSMQFLRCEIFMVVNTKVMVSRDVTPVKLVDNVNILEELGACVFKTKVTSTLKVAGECSSKTLVPIYQTV